MVSARSWRICGLWGTFCAGIKSLTKAYMKLSSLFILAAHNNLNVDLKNPQNNGSRYICNALSCAAEDLGYGWNIKTKPNNPDNLARSIIQSYLGNDTIEEYLAKHHKVNNLDEYLAKHRRVNNLDDGMWEKIQAYRKAWMLHLAEELKKEGK